MDYFLRTVPEVSGESLGLRQKLNATVRNTGNYFFERAVMRQLANCRLVDRLSEVPADADKLVLSMSNFLSPHTDLGWFADALEKCGVRKVVMVGAGAQAESYTDGLTLSPGTRRFVEFLSHHSETIGVRGYFTAERLSDIGIRNVEVIGCPSLFYSCERGFRVDVKSVVGRPVRTVVHCTPAGNYRDAIAHLLSFAVRECEAYIAQSETELIFDDDENLREREFFFRYYNDGDYSAADLQAWARERVKWFFDMDSWLGYMATVDFSVGARFHGNMAALQVGVPALNLVFDTRTRELCEYLNLPYEFLKDFDGRRSASDLYESVDYSLFNATFAGKFDAYARFLARNGISHRLGEPAPERRGGLTLEQCRAIAELVRCASDSGVSTGALMREVALRMDPGRDEPTRKLAEAGQFDVRHASTS